MERGPVSPTPNKMVPRPSQRAALGEIEVRHEFPWSHCKMGRDMVTASSDRQKTLEQSPGAVFIAVMSSRMYKWGGG